MKNELNVISGCSGIGGIDLGLRWTGRFSTVCYIEREPYCIATLLEQMRQGNLDNAPIWTDFTTFDGRAWLGAVDMFIAGIPCQPHSMAGKRLGKEDSRNLWPDMRRIIGEMEPGIVVVENVPGLFVGEQPYGLVIMGELNAMGYGVVSFTLSAGEVGALHKRERRIIVGFKVSDSSSVGLEEQKISISNPKSDRLQGGDKQGCLCEGISQEAESESARGSILSSRWWAVEPDVGRVAHGVPHRVDRLKGIGNAVVPQVAFEVGKMILKIYDGRGLTPELALKHGQQQSQQSQQR